MGSEDSSVVISAQELCVKVIVQEQRHYTTCCSISVQELCESRGGRPGLSVLTSLLVSVDVKNY